MLFPQRPASLYTFTLALSRDTLFTCLPDSLSRARWPTKCQKQGWASRPEFRVLSLGLLADTRLLGKTAQTLRFFSRGAITQPAFQLEAGKRWARLAQARAASRPVFRMDWLDLLAVQGTLKSLLQYHTDDTTLMAESEEELKSLLMKVKVESEKVG